MHICKKIKLLLQIGEGAEERRAVASKGSKAHELRSLNNMMISI